MKLLKTLLLLVCLVSVSEARTNPYILGAAQSAPSVVMVSGALSALTGTDNLDVEIPITGQITAFFLKKDAAASDLIVRTSSMAAGSAKVATTSSLGTITNCIQSLGVGTVQLGNDAECNASGVTFYYWALSTLTADDVEIGQYTGNGADNRDISLTAAWTPGVVMVFPGGLRSSSWATVASLASGAQACFWISANCVADVIQAFGAGSFQVGTNVSVNEGSGLFNYIAVRSGSSVLSLDSNTYTGDATDNRTITLASAFTPVFLAVAEDATSDLSYRFGAQIGDASFTGLAAAAANCIQSFSSGAWSLGNATDCNDSGFPYFWWTIGL